MSKSGRPRAQNVLLSHWTACILSSTLLSGLPCSQDLRPQLLGGTTEYRTRAAVYACHALDTLAWDISIDLSDS